MLETYTIEFSFKAFLIILLIMNIIGFCAMGLDKSFAKQEARRISEKTLLLIAFLGGALGSIIGMKVFKHKTKKVKFTIGLPLLLLLNVALIYLKLKVKIIF